MARARSKAAPPKRTGTPFRCERRSVLLRHKMNERANNELPDEWEDGHCPSSGRSRRLNLSALDAKSPKVAPRSAVECPAEARTWQPHVIRPLLTCQVSPTLVITTPFLTFRHSQAYFYLPKYLVPAGGESVEWIPVRWFPFIIITRALFIQHWCPLFISIT